MKALTFILIVMNSFLYAIEVKAEYSIETFCQDLNVLTQRINVHALNIAHHQTTRTENGDYYKRRIIKNCQKGTCEITIDETAPVFKYQPDHPDAGTNGYVAYPHFSLSEEKALLLKAQKVYDLVMVNAPFKSIDLLIGNKFENCFKNYKYFKEQFDFQTYLGR